MIGYHNGKVNRVFQKPLSGSSYSVPTISVVSPSTSFLAGGGTLTLTGTQLFSGVTVTVGGSICQVNFTNLPTSLTCIIPAHTSGQKDILVTNTDGKTATLSAGITYVPPPVVTSTSPSVGSTDGFTTVTINGTGFQSGATMTLGSEGIPVTFVSSTQLTFVSPSHPSGDVDIVVTNPDTQSGTALSAYTYNTSASESWIAMSTTNAPTGRDNYSSNTIWTGSSMIIWGGSFNTGASYDPNTDSWTALSTINVPSASQDNAVVWTGGKMLVWGGVAGTSLNSGSQFDPITNVWSPLATADAPSPRSSSAYGWTGSKMLVWGGISGPGAYLNDGGSYDLESNTWTLITTIGAPSGRYPGAWVWTGKKLVIWSGYNGAYLSSGGMYDPVTDTWSNTSTVNAPLSRWYSPTRCWNGTKMVVWSGYGPAQYENTGGLFDPETNSWTLMTTLGAPSRRYFSVGACQANKLYVFGGRDAVAYENSGGIYDIDTNSWTVMSTLNAPSSRSGAHAVWTGSKFLIWGGTNGTLLNTGGIYIPPSNALANSWTTITTTGAPSARMFNSSIWTGSHLIVWGGAWSPAKNDGGKYDPVTNSWSTLSSVAIAGRGSHTAVWTGAKMIVWGGYDYLDPATNYNDGASYDVETNSWTILSTIGAPVVRSNHDALWTGARMIVLGGHNNTTYGLNSGGKYDPVNDIWSITSTTNAVAINNIATRGVWTGSEFLQLSTGGLKKYSPSLDAWTDGSTPTMEVSTENSAVAWTGSKMLIWGGCGYGFGNVGCLTNSGAIYDNNSNVWTSMTTTNAPSPRYRMGGVWTGKHFFVFGGALSVTVSSFSNEGGLYDPGTNQWTKTSTLNVPRARESTRNMLFTGKHILMWGGWNVDPLNSGGIFTSD